MKKHLIAALIAVLMCLTALCGCAGVRAFEKDLQVVLNVNGQYYGCYTVNIFNNAVVPEPEPPAEKTFKGWTVWESWTDEQADEVPVIPNTGLVRYDDVKDYVKDKNQSVTLRAVFVPIPKRDLVVAWYNRSVSGITQADMDGFKTNLYAYLTTQNYTPESMDIVIRGYTGQVGDSCSAIAKDGDVDIMVGWSSASNLQQQAGWIEGENYIDHVGKVQVGSTARYATRLTDTELCNLVYTWIQNEYGEGATPPPVNPDDPIPASESRLVVAWYDNSVSGLTQTIIDNFTTGLNAYLTAEGFNVNDLTIRLRAYGDDVATSCGNIMSDGDVDIMLGWGGNINDPLKGNMVEGKDFIENIGSIAMGGKTRYITRITDTALVNKVFDWIEAGNAADLLAKPTEPVIPPDPSEKQTLVIGWWKSSKSGLDEAIMEKAVGGIKSWLAAQGKDLNSIEITVKFYEQSAVADVAAAVNADGDVDVMLGLKAYTGIAVKEQIDNVQMGATITDRRILLLERSTSEIAAAVFGWFKTDESARALLKTEGV